MPKLIVYVPSETWRKLQAKVGGDAAPLARALSRETIEEYVYGEGERVGEPTNEPRVGVEMPADGSEHEVSAPRKRLHPCKHHVPPSRHCGYCDA